VLGVALATAAWASGCGSDNNGGYDPNADGGDGTGEGGGGLLGNGGGDASSKSALVVTPANPVLTVAAGGSPVTQQFKATPPGSSASVAATWSIDNVALGTIDNNGLFTASGTAGGQATISALVGNLTGSTTVTVHLTTTENPGKLDAATQAKLEAGGTADSTFSMLYPYDQTVFPRGLLPPALQFAGQAPTATYVHITTKNLDYKGFFGASNPGKVPLSAATWKTITASAGPSDPVNVEVTNLSAAGVTGPKKQSWTIAQGNLKGTVYYNTYSSPLANGQGAVMRVKPGANADILSSSSTCTVCHAVSANGNTLVTLGGAPNEYNVGEKVDLTTGTVTARGDDKYGFAGVYPDGSKLLTSAAVGGGYPPNIPGVSGSRASELIDLGNAQTLAATGLGGNMLMPSFSPDGKKVVFNHYDTGKGKSLAVMDFDTTKNAFSGLVDVVTDPTLFVGWPAFMPDTKSFVFGTINQSDYATWNSGGNHLGDLYAVDLATKTRVALDAANGMKAGAQYIPYGAGDLHLNYEPTALPLAVGGYYWVVFTSRRQFGNTVVGGDPWSNSPRKKLWVVAIDMNPTAGKDPSHPPFYLEGQEQGAGNMRGFWALDPCKQNGNGCDSGDECCTGFCRQVNGADGGSTLTCVAPPMGCSNEFEKCTVAADCCGAGSGVSCIAGHCATSGPK
jgi:hypothetical protein